ncbi:MAG: response regulator transcription factor [Spirosomataceae bacterium]
MTTPPTLSVAIVDDDADVCEALQWILDQTEGFACYGTFRNCAEVLNGLVASSLPDVVLMDIGLPNQSGVQCVEALKQRFPNLIVLMQTVYSSDDLIFQSLRAGASGYILKKTPTDRLLRAIQDAYEGGAPMSGEVARKVLQFFQQKPPAEQAIAELSERELDVLRLLIEGHQYKTIADKLFVSVHTVRFHLHNIYEKMHVRSRMEAVAKAMKYKLF